MACKRHNLLVEHDLKLKGGLIYHTINQHWFTSIREKLDRPSLAYDELNYNVKSYMVGGGTSRCIMWHRWSFQKEHVG